MEISTCSSVPSTARVLACVLYREFRSTPRVVTVDGLFRMHVCRCTALQRHASRPEYEPHQEMERSHQGQGVSGILRTDACHASEAFPVDVRHFSRVHKNAFHREGAVFTAPVAMGYSRVVDVWFLNKNGGIPEKKSCEVYFLCVYRILL